LNELAQDYLLDHVDEILDQAHDRLAEIERKLRASLTTLAQKRKARKQTTIPVQNSCTNGAAI
jgi:hypothetical protein